MARRYPRLRNGYSYSPAAETTRPSGARLARVVAAYGPDGEPVCYYSPGVDVLASPNRRWTSTADAVRHPAVENRQNRG